MHRHQFITDESRPIRVCRECDAKQVKIRGNWRGQEHLAYLNSEEARDIADALELFDGIDGGENTDSDRLRFLAAKVRTIA